MCYFSAHPYITFNGAVAHSFQFHTHQGRRLPALVRTHSSKCSSLFCRTWIKTKHAWKVSWLHDCVFPIFPGFRNSSCFQLSRGADIVSWCHLWLQRVRRCHRLLKEAVVFVVCWSLFNKLLSVFDNVCASTVCNFSEGRRQYLQV